MAKHQGWLRFSKMHGLGNDFVVIDAVSQGVTVTPALARQLADRHFGIGCDQILVVEPPPAPDIDFAYRIFNADGSEVEQCGNGARCFARFVREQHLSGKDWLRVQTRAGLIELHLEPDGQVRVDMGAPILNPTQIPFHAPERQPTYTLEVDGVSHEISVVSMGNPHAVLLAEDVSESLIASLGPKIEAHSSFPNRVNVGFMTPLTRTEINLRVYERGVGETLACGSGACAAVVAGRLQGILDDTVKVHLRGGTLTVQWTGEGYPVIMVGPATTVFQGRFKL